MSSVIFSHQSPTPSFGRFYTLDQVAGLLGVCKRTVLREIERGKFPRPAKIGRVLRFTLQDVESYAASVRQKA